MARAIEEGICFEGYVLKLWIQLRSTGGSAQPDCLIGVKGNTFHPMYPPQADAPKPQAPTPTNTVAPDSVSLGSKR
jgi:hypothetical protein